MRHNMHAACCCTHWGGTRWEGTHICFEMVRICASFLTARPTPPARPARAPAQHHLVQQVALAYWSLHYTKRILETFLVHT